MQPQTMYWLLLMIGLFITMFVIVPPHVGPKLSYTGFWLGLVQALVLLRLGQAQFNLVRAVGDPTIFGTPILASLAWIPPVIIYAYYFQSTDTPFKKVVLLLIFATGATFVQYVLDLAGMWTNINWNLGYTFATATVTHIIISAFLLSRHKLTKTDL